tara:strand:- start:26033 stop:27196 length:1164 start_codon:yes stop_codon:yes gene_type:complete
MKTNNNKIISKKSTLLHVITGLDDGGAEALLVSILKKDSSNNHIVLSLTKNGKYYKFLKNNDYKVYQIEKYESYFLIPALIKIYYLVNKYKPKLIIGWMYHSCFLISIFKILFKNRINIIWNLHITSLKRGFSFTKLIRFSLRKLSHTLKNRIIYCSNAGELYHKKLGFFYKKSSVIFNGYDLEKFQFSSNDFHKSEKLNFKESNFLMAMVARYHPQKDHENLFKSLHILKNFYGIEFNCLLVGSGMDYRNNELKKLIDIYDLNKNILLLGQRNDIPLILKEIDVHILSSSFGESFPNVICEAMLSGVPCIATDVGDSKYIISKTGWIVDPKNPKDLAKAINESYLEYLKKDTWLIRKKNCRSRIEINFSLTKMINQFKELWELSII